VAPVQPKSTRAAWLQGVAVVMAVVVLVAVTLPRRDRPFARDTLALPVDELRSQAAEADLLEQQMRRDHLAPGFVRFHAQQMGRDVGRTRDALARKRAARGLDPLRAEAVALAASLQSRLEALGRNGALPREASLHFDALADALDALDRRIKPEG
jgi:hypothetical protein